MKDIKIEWCENFIRAKFKEIEGHGTGIYCGLMFDMAERAGLYIKGTYGSSFSQALENITNVETARNDSGAFLYHYFTLK